MTLDEACVRFNLDKKQLKRRLDAGMVLDVRKVGRVRVLPDDTKMIPAKHEIAAFLLQILKYKNNSAYSISRSLCPTEKSLRIVMDYLYRRGFISGYTFSPSIQETFQSTELTDSGFEYILGASLTKKLELHATVPINTYVGCGFVGCK